MVKYVLIFGFCVLCAVEVKTGCSKYDYMDFYRWWGPEETKHQANTSIIPFKITFDDDMIADLRCGLKRSGLLSSPFYSKGFSYGVNMDYLRDLSKYWAEEYKFKERAEYLNIYSHYLTNIQGLNIHFIQYRTNVHRCNTTILPLIMLHGWPGSVLEFYDAIKKIEMICLNKDFDFDIIVPSLPGFGYSDAAVIPGLGANEASVVMRNLMHRLGYKKYYVQGGDWGAVTGANMAVLFCDEVLGYHTNFPLALTLTSLATYIYGTVYQDSVVNASLANRLYPATEVLGNYIRETGYFHIQAAKPNTIGIALSTSPIAFLAWIIQAISSMNPNNINREDGGVEDNLSRDTILDDVMLYWATNKVTSSIRYYAETCRRESISTGLQAAPVTVPTWAVQARYEFLFMTEDMLKSRFLNLLNVTILPIGQHMLAWELPGVFAQSVVDGITKLREFNEAAVTCSLV